MKFRIGFQNIKIENFISYIVYILPLIGLLGISLPYIAGLSEFSIVGIYLLIPLLTTPILYYVYFRGGLETKSHEKIESTPLLKISVIVFSLCYTVSVILLYLVKVRPRAYFIIVSIMFTTVLLQAAYVKLSNISILVMLSEMALISLNIAYGVTLKYPFFIGRTDLTTHVGSLSRFLVSRDAASLSTNYEAFPLWYIYNSVIYDLANLTIPIQQYPMVVNGLIYGIGIFITYVVATSLVGNRRIGIFTALFLTTNQNYIFYSMYSIPRGVVGIIFITLLTTVVIVQSKCKKQIILYLLTVSIILYHPASIPFIGFLLVAFTVGEYLILADSKLFPLSYVIIVGVTSLAYWMYEADVIFESIFSQILTRLFAESGDDPTPSGVFEFPWAEMFNYLHYSPLLIFVLIGGLWFLIDKRVNISASVMVIGALFFVAIGLPGPDTVLGLLPNLGRFNLYTYFFTALAGASGFYLLFYSSKREIKIIFIILFVSMCFLSVSNDFVASDNPTIEREFYTYYLEESELAAYDSVDSHFETTIVTDRPSSRYLRNTLEYSPVTRMDPEVYDRDMEQSLLVRTTELERRPLQLTQYTYNTHPVWDTLEQHNHIYSSGGVDLYQ